MPDDPFPFYYAKKGRSTLQEWARSSSSKSPRALTRNTVSRPPSLSSYERDERDEGVSSAKKLVSAHARG